MLTFINSHAIACTLSLLIYCCDNKFRRINTLSLYTQLQTATMTSIINYKVGLGMDNGRLPFASSPTSVVPRMQELEQKKLALLRKRVSLQQRLHEFVHQEKCFQAGFETMKEINHVH